MCQHYRWVGGKNGDGILCYVTNVINYVSFLIISPFFRQIELHHLFFNIIFALLKSTISNMNERERKFKIIDNYYKSHYEELRSFVCKRIGDIYESEDIVQNVFLRLLSSDKMLSTVTLPCLIYTTARNLIYDYWRHHSSVDEYEHYYKAVSSDGEDSVSSVMSVTEITDILEKGIARLTDKQRNIYRLSIFDDLKVSEISYTLGVNYKYVENNLGVARKEIRQYVNRMLA